MHFRLSHVFWYRFSHRDNRDQMSMRWLKYQKTKRNGCISRVFMLIKFQWNDNARSIEMHNKWNKCMTSWHTHYIIHAYTVRYHIHFSFSSIRSCHSINWPAHRHAHNVPTKPCFKKRFSRSSSLSYVYVCECECVCWCVCVYVIWWRLLYLVGSLRWCCDFSCLHVLLKCLHPTIHPSIHVHCVCRRPTSF